MLRLFSVLFAATFLNIAPFFPVGFYGSPLSIEPTSSISSARTQQFNLTSVWPNYNAPSPGSPYNPRLELLSLQVLMRCSTCLSNLRLKKMGLLLSLELYERMRVWIVFCGVGGCGLCFVVWGVGVVFCDMTGTGCLYNYLKEYGLFLITSIYLRECRLCFLFLIPIFSSLLF